MKVLVVSLLSLFCFSGICWSQSSPFPSNSSAGQPPNLTAKDFRVLPFAEEHKEIEFKATDRQIPNELIVTTGDHVHFYGKKRGRVVDVLGKPTGHVGKLVLLPPGDRSGTLTLKKAFGTAFFFTSVEIPGNALDSKRVELKEGNTYTWSIKTEGPNTIVRVLASDNAEISSQSVPKDKVLGVGFAGTVRNEGNEIDMTINFNR